LAETAKWTRAGVEAIGKGFAGVGLETELCVDVARES
jgi:hypothetical protein